MRLSANRLLLLRAVICAGALIYALLLTPPAQAEVGAPESALETYAGVYEFPSGQGLSIQRAGQHLTLQMDGKAPVDLIQKAPTVFIEKGANVHIRFDQDGGGQTTALEFREGAVDSTAMRLDAQGITAHQAAVAARQARVASQTPDPRSEAAVRDLLAGITSGNLNYDTMTQDMAVTIRRQFSAMQRSFVTLGPIRSVVFLGVDTNGADHYEVRQLNGKSQFEVLMTPNGLIGFMKASDCTFRLAIAFARHAN